MSTEDNHEKSKLTFTTKGAWIGFIAYLVLIAVLAIIIKLG
jgi:hypothetical protein